MKLADLDLSKTYTYADYLKWSFEERVELIKGRIFKMSPAPNPTHQRISSRIHLVIGNYLQDKQCEVFAAPFDVRIPRKAEGDKDIITVLQPDMCVICDPAKVDDKGCLGAPDIAIEILSPANNKKELKYKHEIYEEAGVKEYWVIDPREKSAQVYLQTNGRLLASGHLYAGDMITTSIFPGLSLDLTDLFRNL